MLFRSTGTIQATDFDLTDEQRDLLFENGRKAAKKFFDGGDGQAPWSLKAYNDKFRQSD